MAHHHSPGFLALVHDARQRVKTIGIPEYQRLAAADEPMVLIDTREDHEWVRGHLPGAIHMSKGIIERDIENTFGDRRTPIVCYCGGGFRSVLVADSLQKMGYTNVLSLEGGFRGWTAARLPIEEPALEGRRKR